MEAEKIKSISEAFSMQPITLSVTEPNKRLEFSNPKDHIKEIKDIGIDGESYYVGYNYDGKKLFKYVGKSVNVHYF